MEVVQCSVGRVSRHDDPADRCDCARPRRQPAGDEIGQFRRRELVSPHFGCSGRLQQRAVGGTVSDGQRPPVLRQRRAPRRTGVRRGRRVLIGDAPAGCRSHRGDLRPHHERVGADDQAAQRQLHRRRLRLLRTRRRAGAVRRGLRHRNRGLESGDRRLDPGRDGFFHTARHESWPGQRGILVFAHQRQCSCGSDHRRDSRAEHRNVRLLD